ncbi:MAG: hypothetical protein IK139_02845, partial [Lachnospiraceae bacterium]|nr:hypothetical protein [Lachnospiraceae bacterium]
MIKHLVRKVKNDDTGSAMVMVIVAVAFLGILVATLMWVTMANYYMKTTDAKNKETFYSAETVFEEIKAGMQKDASDAVLRVYQTSFGDYTNGTTEAELQDRFLNEIYLSYRDPSNPDRFDAGKLIAYIEEMFNPFVAAGRDEHYAGPLVYGPDGVSVYETAVICPAGINIQKTDKNVILKNITIQFYDHATGNYSEITSDLSVGLPSVRFSKASALPAIFEYSIIGDTGITIENGTQLVLKKSAYAGKNGITVGQGFDPMGAAKATLDAQNAEYVVTRGTLSLNGMDTSQKAELITGNTTRLYAHDIDLSKGSGLIRGKTYVANDLKYSAAADMKISGDYFGFGNSTVSANESSAMIVNSKYAKLDLKDAGSVLISGHAFIGTSDEESKSVSSDAPGGRSTLSGNSGDILMDESISVKGDQVQYLIPGTCIGVWKEDGNIGEVGDVLVGKNPVPDITVSINGAGQAEPNFYTSRYLTGDYDISTGHIETVDFTRPVAALGGKTLGDYSSSYKVVYKNQYGQLLAYFYLMMTEENAKQYAQDYYDNKKENVDSYYRYYLDDSFIDESPGTSSNSITTAGHYLNGPDIDSLAFTEAKSSSLLQGQNNVDISATYNSLCTKLTTDSTSVSANDMTRTVFENIVDETKLPAGEVIYYSGSLAGPDVVRAVVTPVDYTYTGSDPSIHMIVAGGNVEVEANFSGVILAKGTINFKNGAIEVSEDRLDLVRLLQTVDIESGTPQAGVTKPLQYFRDGPQYILEGTAVSSNHADREEQKIDFGEL